MRKLFISLVFVLIIIPIQSILNGLLICGTTGQLNGVDFFDSNID